MIDRLNFIKYRNYSYLFSGTLIVLSLLSLAVWGLRLGIDFTGGSIITVQYSVPLPSREAVTQTLQPLDLHGLSVQPAENNQMNLRYQDATGDLNSKVTQALQVFDPNLTVLRTDFIGGVVSSEITKNAFIGIVLSMLAIVLFIAYAFRKVSGGATSWDYGFGALIALFHDILITVGVFSVLGHFYGIEIGVPFIAALLTILGYSVNDTIVVYDRIRENLMRLNAKEDFGITVNRSLNETLGRSISTSLTVLITLLAITLYGGASTFSFALALLVGIGFGTYSSIFVASALLVSRYNYKMRFVK